MIFSRSGLQFRINLYILLFFPVAMNLVICAPFKIWFWVGWREKFDIPILDNIFWAFVCISITSVNNIVCTISKDDSLWLSVVDLNVAAILIEYYCVVTHYCGCYIVISIYVHVHYLVLFKKRLMFTILILLIVILTVYYQNLNTDY